MKAPSPFANYLQLPLLLPQRLWDALRLVSVLTALGLAALLALQPAQGLTLFWGVVVPLLPALFLVAPGIWRNLCPMAALNQLPRRLGFSRGLTHTPRIREYSYVVGIALFLLLVSSRKWLFDASGAATAGLILFGLVGAFAGGLVFKGKSGWCSSICPMLPVQRIYGQTPYALVANSHCRPCVGCTKNCYDFNPGVAYLADQYDPDRHYVAYRRLFNSLLPGFIAAFFTVPAGASLAEIYGLFALYGAVSVAVFHCCDTFLKVPPNTITVLSGAAAFNFYYTGISASWFEKLSSLTGHWSVPTAAPWVVRVGALLLTLGWVVRSFERERAFRIEVVQKSVRQPITLGEGAASALKQAGASTQAELVIAPENRKVPALAGQTLLELIEGSGARIESGCRMGVCGADPIAVKDGMGCLSPASDDEQNTLARLGHAGNTRMACCARLQQGTVTIALVPDKAAPPAAGHAQVFDRSVQRVIVVGNGIAGITAADHVRRRHPECSIQVVADENHALYNRMGITRLIYGRSAMQGLYLMADSWYGERNIEVLLNTAARAIQPAEKQLLLADGETLAYDRLILAAGSRSFVPPLPGWGGPGCYVLRSADDAMDLRAYVQKAGSRHAVVAGGGLLGLEAAYALHKLGLKVAVVERNAWLLHRQLDERGGAILQRYLQSLGLNILTSTLVDQLVQGEAGQQLQLQGAAPLAADVLVMAAGIAPNVALAQAAGLTVKRGVLVDAAMRTSDPHIYAAGDVAEYEGRTLGLWPVAVEQAEVAACNALGEVREYREPVLSTMLKVVGADVYSMGRYEAGEGDEDWAEEDAAEHRYRKLVWHEGKLAGAILIGWPELAEPVGKAVKSGRDVSAQLSAIRAGNWSGLKGG
ncbi:FAD-dependent oxidoreductase [Chitinimonas sp.]|uniref:FAD-dependent oxidoreductase n=1 Tax=Chitinimonas sp. TaxID=1934313 RepID=UPI002F947466